MIWQNVAPKIVTEAQSAYSTIEHELLANELLTNIEETAKAQFFNYDMPYIDLDKEIQWMVFKVKQRASRDYFTKIKRRIPDMPFYTENWPYDFCSLVELAKLDATVQFKKISPERKVGYKELTPEEAAAFAGRGEAGSGYTNRAFSRPVDAPDTPDASSGGGGSIGPNTEIDGPETYGGENDESSGGTLLTPGSDLDAETFVGQLSDDLKGSLEEGPGAVGDVAGGYSGGTAGTDAAGSALGGIGAGARRVQGSGDGSGPMGSN